MLIERKKGSFRNLEFEIDLRDYDKLDANITEITFLVKQAAADLDDSLFRKRLTVAEITKIANTEGDIITVSVQWPTDEYSQFTIGTEYDAGLYCHFNGDPVHDENVTETFKIKIVQDFIIA